MQKRNCIFSTVADLGGAKGTIAPPFLKSQEVQKNECIDIRTQ